MRRAAFGIGAVIAAGLALSLAVWAAGPTPLKPLAVRVVWTTLPILSSLVLAMPLWALAVRPLQRLAFHLWQPSPSARTPTTANPLPSRHATRREPTTSAHAIEDPQLSRRQVIQGLATLPLLGVPVLAGRGFTLGAAPTRIVKVPFSFPDLPEALDGLKILHLSDLHLGPAKQLGDLLRLLDQARSHAPDLVVLTGDVGEDLKQLEAALEHAVRLGAPLGTFAVLGNHEYISGIDKTLPIYRKSRARFLLDQRVDLDVRGAKLSILGVDDPKLKGNEREFYARVIPPLCKAPSDFRLLLCHRPIGFAIAAREGVELTLSGHTHGGQFGLEGKSLFERTTPYMWGSYAEGKSRLYTTSGFGHWFPYRLGCPAEAALIELRRAPRVSNTG
jgi:predicted MPP superfamily phosphohydrolase